VPINGLTKRQEFRYYPSRLFKCGIKKLIVKTSEFDAPKILN
jgi:hypothetical protein